MSEPSRTSLDHAREYARLGYRVAPIPRGHKYPAGFGEWQKIATRHADQIAKWWSGDGAGHGVGLVMGAYGSPVPDGPYVFAVDIDGESHDVDGWGAWLDSAERHGFDPNIDTVTSLTGGGGKHLLFLTDEPITNADTLVGYEREIQVRGVGGCIVVAPSIHPDTGFPYEWEHGHAPWDRAPTWAPAELIGALTEKRRSQARERPTFSVAPALDLVGDRPGDLFATQVDWAQILEPDGWTLARVDPNGERHWTRPGKAPRQGTSATTGYTANDNLKVFTSSVPFLDADGVYSKLGYVAARDHGSDHAAAARTLKAEGYSSAERTSALEPIGGSPLSSAVGDPLAGSYIDWPVAWEREVESDWLLEPVLAKGRTHALYATAKTGKSYLMLAMAAALATGRPFLACPGGPRARILYVDFEMTEDDVLYRLAEFGYGSGDDLSNLFYAVLPSLAPLDTDEGGQALVAAAIARQADFVIIDTTARAVAGDENDSTTIRDFYRFTGVRLKALGIGWARLDHAGKDATKGQRGSSAKNDDVDVVWRLTRTEPGYKLVATHRRMGWVPETVAVDSVDTDGVVDFRLANGLNTWPAGTAEMAAQLDAQHVPTSMGERRVRKTYAITGSNEVLRAAIRYRKTRRQAAAIDGAPQGAPLAA